MTVRLGQRVRQLVWEDGTIGRNKPSVDVQAVKGQSSRESYLYKAACLGGGSLWTTEHERIPPARKLYRENFPIPFSFWVQDIWGGTQKRNEKPYWKIPLNFAKKSLGVKTKVSPLRSGFESVHCRDKCPFELRWLITTLHLGCWTSWAFRARLERVPLFMTLLVVLLTAVSGQSSFQQLLWLPDHV